MHYNALDGQVLFKCLCVRVVSECTYPFQDYRPFDRTTTDRSRERVSFIVSRHRVRTYDYISCCILRECHLYIIVSKHAHNVALMITMYNRGLNEQQK